MISLLMPKLVEKLEIFYTFIFYQYKMFLKYRIDDVNIQMVHHLTLTFKKFEKRKVTKDERKGKVKRIN